jgi:two-component system phosphate regulon sensor histidine kinase PhoR
MISKLRLFSLIFIPAALTLLCGMALIKQKNDELSLDQFRKLLVNQWSLVSLYAQSGTDFSALRDVCKKAGLRATIVEATGEVVFDSDVSGPMEDHLDREEIRRALSGEPFHISHYSRSTGISTIYYAQLLANGDILRVSYPLDYYRRQREALFLQTSFGLLLILSAAAVFAFLMSSHLGRIFSSLSAAVAAAQRGETSLPSFASPPLDEALYSLSLVTRELTKANGQIMELNRTLEYILNSINEGVLFLEGPHVIFQNKRASEILDFQVPEDIRTIESKEMIDLFASFSWHPENEGDSARAGLKAIPRIQGEEHKENAGGQGDKIDFDAPAIAGITGRGNFVREIGNRVVSLEMAQNGPNRLIILSDVSDREKYLGFKSELVGNLSHELKTPLTLVLAAAEVIMREKEIERPYLEKFLTTIHKNGLRLDALINDLMFLHKLESSKPLDAMDLLGEESQMAEILSDLEELLETGGKKIRYHCQLGKVGIIGAHLHSVLVNLISNAVKYSAGDEIVVRIFRKSGWLMIEVEDQGPVIPIGERARIFERFYSISKSRNRNHSGSGLGLSVVKHIARLYRGQAEAKENENSGNTFLVRLLEGEPRCGSSNDGLNDSK